MSGDRPADGRPVAGLLALPALAAMLVFAANLESFSRLFYFGDEWHQLEQMNELGFWRWTLAPFTESFLPVFKFSWGAAILLLDGSYLGMLTLLWLCHALNVYLYGRLLRRAGLDLGATLAAQVLLGLTPAHIETLGWTIQLSPLLSTTFLLLGLLEFQRLQEGERGPVRWSLFAAFVSLSALTFARGILVGLSLALVAALPWPLSGKEWRWRLGTIALSLGPAAATAAAAIGLSEMGHHLDIFFHLRSNGLQILDFSLRFLTLNPLSRLLGLDVFSGTAGALLGAVKAALLGLGVARARGALRTLFVLLLVFDLGNSALVGFGRFHTGAEAAISSRYQYQPLLVLAPVIGLLVSAALRAALRRDLAARWATALIALALAVGFAAAWRPEIATWASWRGAQYRRQLEASGGVPAADGVPGLPHFDAGAAAQLIETYNLR